MNDELNLEEADKETSDNGDWERRTAQKLADESNDTQRAAVPKVEATAAILPVVEFVDSRVRPVEKPSTETDTALLSAKSELPEPRHGMPPASVKAITDLIVNLASDSYAERERASKQLSAFREAIPFMDDALADMRASGKTDLEQARRLTNALRAHGLSSDAKTVNERRQERADQLPADTRDRISKLIDQLASDSYEERERANAQLRAFPQTVPFMAERLQDMKDGRAQQDLEQQRRLERTLRAHGFETDGSLTHKITDPDTGKEFVSIGVKGDRITRVTIGEGTYSLTKDGAIVTNAAGKVVDEYKGKVEFTFDGHEFKIKANGRTQGTISISALEGNTQFNNLMSRLNRKK